MSQERRTITVSEVIRLLDEGMHRPQIAEYFGLSMSDVNKLFKNDALKGKKARKAPGFVLVDDTEGRNEATDYNNVVDNSQQVEKNVPEVTRTETPTASTWNN